MLSQIHRLLLWHTNSHQCVDRLNFCISGNSSLSPVCKPSHAEATKEKRVAHLLFKIAGSIQSVNHGANTAYYPSLAQLVEQWTLNPWVIGSSPIGRTKRHKKKPFVQGFLLVLKSICYDFINFLTICWSSFISKIKNVIKVLCHSRMRKYLILNISVWNMVIHS